jgi:hypothetical protein
MMGTREILDLVRPLATNAELAKILNLPPPRITDLYKGARKLQLEEAKLLIETFNLGAERTQRIVLPAAQLAVMHVAHGLGINDPSPAVVEELSKDLLALYACALDPQWAGEIGALAQMLQGIEARKKAQQKLG